MPVITSNSNKVSSPGEKIKASYWIWSAVFFVFALVLIIHYFPEIKKEVLLLEKVRKYWLAVAICSQMLTYFFAAMVYRVLLKAYKLQRYPGLWELLKAAVISLFFNQTMPSGGISGNTFIFRFLKRFNMPVTAIISLIITELICFYSAMEALIISLLLACITVYRTPQVFKATLAGGILIFIVLGAVIVFAGGKKFLIHLYEKIRRMKFIGKKLSLDFPQSGVQEMPFLKKNWGKVIKGTLFQLLVIAADSFTIYALFRGMGVQLSAFVIILAYVSTRIISVLPVSPGSLVLYESSMAFFFVSLGAHVGTAIIVTLLYRLLSFWFPMPVGFILYRSELKKSLQVRETDENSSSQITGGQ